MTDRNLNLCLIPLEIEWEDYDRNMAAVESLLAEVHPATDLVVLPETFSTGFPSGETREKIAALAQPNDGDMITRLKAVAAARGFAIAGSFIAREGDDFFNRAFFIEPSGDTVFADKRHLFSMAGENKVFTPGSDRLKTRFRGWEIAMVVCYDVRFPVWCRNVSNDYDLLIAVANWPVNRIDAWNKLLPARAIENLSYVAAVDCQGTDKKGFVYDGSSMIVDFKGKILTQYPSPESSNLSPKVSTHSPFLYSSLSLEKLNAFRTKFRAYIDADPFSFK